MDREAWTVAIHGVAKNWTRLRDWTEVIHHISCICLHLISMPVSLCSQQWNGQHSEKKSNWGKQRYSAWNNLTRALPSIFTYLNWESYQRIKVIPLCGNGLIYSINILSSKIRFLFAIANRFFYLILQNITRYLYWYVR